MDQRNPRQADYEGSGDFTSDDSDDYNDIINVIRISVVIDLPWESTSQQFSTVSQQIKDGINDFLSDIEDFQADTTMLKFNPTNIPDETLVLMDFSTISDEDTLKLVKNKIESAMKNSEKIGKFTIQPASENWWRPIGNQGKTRKTRKF